MQQLKMFIMIIIINSFGTSTEASAPAVLSLVLSLYPPPYSPLTYYSPHLLSPSPLQSPPMAVLSINSCDPQGQTPLHKASLLGHINMVDLLLAHGAMPDVRARESQQTPLHLACQYNQQDVRV